MEWVRLLLDFIRDIAWPVSVVITVIILRKHFSTLTHLVSKIRYKDFEAEFDKAESKAKELPVASRLSELEPDRDREERFLKMASDYPVAAVINAWSEVESAIIALRTARRDKKAPTNDFDFLLQLKSKGELDPSVYRLFRYLMNLRNKAVHAQDSDTFSTGEAIQYRKLTQALVKQLEETTKQVVSNT
ncbi:MAG: hypothetical protein IID55_11710 [Proteobacteria bacterium]|nr:hypothetical protein [Pseudomonadota bacterium]